MLEMCGMAPVDLPACGWVWVRTRAGCVGFHSTDNEPSHFTWQLMSAYLKKFKCWSAQVMVSQNCPSQQVTSIFFPSFILLDVYLCFVYLVPMELFRWCCSPWNWSYRWLYGRREPNPGPTTNALKCWAISPAPSLLLPMNTILGAGSRRIESLTVVVWM